MQFFKVAIFLFLPLFVFAGSNSVYRCQNAQGKVVFQQQVCAESNVINNTPAYNLWKSMKALSDEGKAILSKLGPDLESIKQCGVSIKKYQNKIENLDAQIKLLGRENPQLFKAYTYLNDCSVCRSSAESNCQLADKYLEKAVSKITQY